jgi:hypothetical protein
MPNQSKSPFIGFAQLFCLIAVLAIAGLAPSYVAAADQPKIIRKDLGGSVADRVSILQRLKATGQPVEIRGQCASSCTMYLGLPNTCVAPNARLGFHGPQSALYGISLPADEFEYWSHLMADEYPPRIRSWFLTTARNVTVGAYFISGREAIRLGARACA